MPQVERVSAQLVDELQELGDQWRAALEDGVVTVDEVSAVTEQLVYVTDVALAHDEDVAIGIAVIRTGRLSQRSQRLIRQRERRLAFDAVA